MNWLVFLAQAEGRDPFRTPEVVWGTAGIALALLAGAFAVWLMERWRKRAVPKQDVAGELTDYRGMFERGEITEDEYAKLRNRVAQRAKGDPPPAAAPAGPVPGFPTDLADLDDEEDDSDPRDSAGNRPPGPGTPPPGPGDPADRPPPA